MLSKGETIMTKEEVELSETLYAKFRERAFDLVRYHYVNFNKATDNNELYWRNINDATFNDSDHIEVSIDNKENRVEITYTDVSSGNPDFDDIYHCSFNKEFLWNDEAFRKYVADKVDEHYKNQELFELAQNRIAELDAKKKEEEERALCLELMKKYGYGEPKNG